MMRYFFKVKKGDDLFDIVYGRMVVTEVDHDCITAITEESTKVGRQPHQVCYNLDGRHFNDAHEFFQRLYYWDDKPTHTPNSKEKTPRAGEITLSCGQCHSTDIWIIHPETSKMRKKHPSQLICKNCNHTEYYHGEFLYRLMHNNHLRRRHDLKPLNEELNLRLYFSKEEFGVGKDGYVVMINKLVNDIISLIERLNEIELYVKRHERG